MFRPSQLVKFLQNVASPIFLVDTDATLIFCNRALEEWTGCEAETLIGQRLRYRGPASRQKHEIVAAALAPPPEVFSNQAQQQRQKIRILLSMDHIKSVSRRWVDFLPLGSTGVLAIVETEEATATVAVGSVGMESSIPTVFPVSAERHAAAELHQALLSFRRRQAGRFRWDRMIGTSQQMQRVRRLARLSVDTTASVLILGEPGTGKEHLATAIHYGQTTSETPGALVPVDCRVLGRELIASTIYAFRKRFQREETDRRHTLLLQEAEYLSDTLFSTVTEFVTASPANQRIIATSSLEPERWTNHSSFPIVLGTIRIDLPPLRQRKDDIPLLAQMFLEDQNETADRQRSGFSSEALDVLVRYHWPGNIEELERMIVEAHGRQRPNSQSTLIVAADLPNRLHDVFDADVQASTEDEPIELESFLHEIERELIERALRHTDGNRSKAAELLGITRPKLYRRLEQFDSDHNSDPQQ